MNFEPGEDQKAFRETARAFAAGHMAPHAARWDEENIFPRDVLVKAAELGFAGLYVGEDVGGSGLTRLDAVLVFEELSRACPSTAAFLSIHNMASWMIDAHGSHEQRARLLPDLTSMRRIASYCLTEPGAGSDAAAPMEQAPILSRPPSRPAMAILKPSPSPPMRLSAGTRQPSNSTMEVGWECQPSFFSCAPKVRPGVALSTARQEMPAGPGPPVRAITT